MKLTGYTLVLALVLVLCLAHVPAAAQDTRPAELQSEDQKLNDIYIKIMKRLPDADKDKFRKSQRAWIAFRDLDCKWAYGAVPLDCMIDRTHNRIKELEETVFYDAKGRYQVVRDTAKL
ncbi:MAG: lysozyme inhibitor LprI family protein [Ramlibacter sp.]|nr:lysozyme inhibitor LprI family protein [Ramlibacter sp.]